MRVLVDTNILFSALLFPHSKLAHALWHVVDNHQIVLCDRNIAELRRILRRKAPEYMLNAELMLAKLSYELISDGDHAEGRIRDPEDQPILNAAVAGGVDIILTGDKDFLSLDMERPRCLNVTQFLEQEGVEF